MLFSLYYLIFLFLSLIDPSVGHHLCFERDKKRYRGTKNDIAGQKTISRDISFLCHRVIARIKAQVCDNICYQSNVVILFITMLRFLSCEDLDPNLHDNKSTPHSGSRARSRLKKWNELKPEWDAIQSGFKHAI